MIVLKVPTVIICLAASFLFGYIIGIREKKKKQKEIIDGESKC